MLYEDDLSYLNGKYFEAMVRQRDYDRYYILASRYGCYSVEEYTRDSRPGRRYFIAVERGARKFQALWDRYWAMTKLRRYRAAKNIQKHIRRFVKYKQLHPIIKMRLKIGKRSYYQHYLLRWREYNDLCRRVKNMIKQSMGSYVDKCFHAWVRFVGDVKKQREVTLHRMIVRTKNANVYNKFIRWAFYTREIHRVKRHLRRLFGFPHFDVWVKFTKWSKHMKRINRAATKMQSQARSFVKRKQFLRQKSAQVKLKYFILMVVAMRFVRLIRKKTITHEFSEWLPDEQKRRHSRLMDLEKQRLTRRQQIIAEKEKAALKELKRHLKSHHGQVQLSEYALELMGNKELFAAADISFDTFNRYSKHDKLEYARKRLLEQCSQITREIEIHNYHIKHPPTLHCADPHCNLAFVSEAHYHNHMGITPNQHEFPELQFSHLHMMMRHQKGHELLRHHFVRKFGVAGIVNCIDAWLSIQDWRKCATQTGNYVSKAVSIFELYIIEDGSRVTQLTFDGLVALREKLNAVKHRETNGFFHTKHAKQSTLREWFGFAGESYEQWSTETILPPSVFDQFEWQCFLAVMRMVDGCREEFEASEEYAEYQRALAKEAEAKDGDFLVDYKNHRSQVIAQWTHAFKQQETAMFNKAEEVLRDFMEREVAMWYEKAEKKTVREAVARIHYAEQVDHEAKMMQMDEALSVTEEDITEFVFDFYVRSMLTTMLGIPECRRGMLEYAGLIRANLKKKLIVDDKGTQQTESVEWFKQFFQSTSQADQQMLPKDKNVASMYIQKIVRGVLMRSKVRKVFVKTYAKRFDSESGCYYYVNQRTGESSWERPKMTKHLFPKSNW